ncbi:MULTISPECIES: DivIVA domain-containing protein [Calothrix]|uniref:DivIVA domain-containing protein n=2 Tax=Calothrix TaxID=1186 RepID=A0ABR8AHV1_9CYAN|nr:MULTISPECIES: DivIVA domain-containing protein [Calothrix]MBD2199625.1 DivIVA domain-containing protein [Calothrix parietina FACHB-288]MBD2228378.1 DivIVA domain-containing protein [Calothrix anomala FACHB-343]
MLQPQLSNVEPDRNGNNLPSEDYPEGAGTIDLQEELARLEDIIVSGFRIPLTGRTLVDDEKLLEQLDFIRASLPSVFQEAGLILDQKEEILLEAEEYGQQVVEAAQAKRAQILAESDIIKQAEREAEQLRRQVQQECDAMMQETLAEIEEKRRACMQELEEMRQAAIAQAQEIENGADQYADSVLEGIEQDLKDMLRIVTNGRQELRAEMPPQRNSPPPKKR